MFANATLVSPTPIIGGTDVETITVSNCLFLNIAVLEQSPLPLAPTSGAPFRRVEISGTILDEVAGPLCGTIVFGLQADILKLELVTMTNCSNAVHFLENAVFAERSEVWVNLCSIEGSRTNPFQPNGSFLFLCNPHTTITLNSSSFAHCTASEDGGCVWTSSRAQIEIENSSATNCSAGGRGGWDQLELVLLGGWTRRMAVCGWAGVVFGDLGDIGELLFGRERRRDGTGCGERRGSLVLSRGLQNEHGVVDGWKRCCRDIASQRRLAASKEGLENVLEHVGHTESVSASGQHAHQLGQFSSAYLAIPIVAWLERKKGADRHGREAQTGKCEVKREVDGVVKTENQPSSLKDDSEQASPSPTDHPRSSSYHPPQPLPVPTLLMEKDEQNHTQPSNQSVRDESGCASEETDEHQSVPHTLHQPSPLQ
ncbi:hypothetical protein BLNAU_12822 [Blattamonas nauphoetae]|uniref:Uncharacterized protein n=1 Tax=Blattamonas nauphoetae TaxID=2049346 RepID=A0ABQ9XLR0_9EUKA|nr:hypothetical protein BLNAU_12822 [Blattamonas nauphoetae]